MSYEKVGRLIDSLYNNTKSADITWEESEKDGTYQVSFPKYSVRIFNRFNEHEYDTKDYFIQIINENGIVIDEVSDIDVKEVIQDAFYKMKEIHDLARRQALGVDEALDAILGNLDEPPF